MNRADALMWLKSSFDPAMLQIGRTTGDEMSGYAPAIDRAFALHASVHGLPTPLTSVAPEYTLHFSTVLEASAADLISIGYARMVDINVDAPLMGMKLSQAWRQFNTLRERLWRDAASYGYVTVSNVGGWAINMDYIEPSGTSASGEYAPP
jgi:hypothetical protein